jgi:hypothetical protein
MKISTWYTSLSQDPTVGKCVSLKLCQTVYLFWHLLYVQFSHNGLRLKILSGSFPWRNSVLYLKWKSLHVSWLNSFRSWKNRKHSVVVYSMKFTFRWKISVHKIRSHVNQIVRAFPWKFIWRFKSEPIYQLTWRNIPEDLNLQQYRLTNLKPLKHFAAYISLKNEDGGNLIKYIR